MGGGLELVRPQGGEEADPLAPLGLEGGGVAMVAGPLEISFCFGLTVAAAGRLRRPLSSGV